IGAEWLMRGEGSMLPGGEAPHTLAAVPVLRTAAEEGSENSPDDYITGRRLRILPITVDSSNRENIVMVDTKAAAGYLRGLEQPEYFSGLPAFSLPGNDFRGGTFRTFQVKGESMLPGITPGDWIIARYLQNWAVEIVEGYVHVVVTREDGPLVKRVLNRISDRGELTLVSDNPDYNPYSVNIEDVAEVWLAKAHMTFNFTKRGEGVSADFIRLKDDIAMLRNDMQKMRKKKK
ncbi:MAG: S24 family peptidase, partial [Bacteroidota bacterium]|nr:S24 family peptidase [Bacteroidota bacterium]